MWGNLVVWALGALVGIAVVIVIHRYLTASVIREKVAEEYPNAFTAKIKKKKKDAIDVGIFDKQNNELDEVSFKSSKGIDKSLRKGQVIHI